MKPKFFRKITARLVFVIGLFLMLLGISILFDSLEGTSGVFVFSAFLLVLAGAFCAVLAIRLNKRASYLFFASFFMMAGLYLFLSALRVIPLPFSRAWPLLSVFSGLALLPAGWWRYGALPSRYIVSSSAFVILGCVLLIFSLDVVPFSFRQFILVWWPLLFVTGGLTLILISLSAKNSRGGKKPSSGSEMSD